MSNVGTASLLVGLGWIGAGGFGGGGIFGGYTPDVHKPLPTDDARNLAQAEAKRERRRLKRAALTALESE